MIELEFPIEPREDEEPIASCTACMRMLKPSEVASLMFGDERRYGVAICVDCIRALKSIVDETLEEVGA